VLLHAVCGSPRWLFQTVVHGAALEGGYLRSVCLVLAAWINDEFHE
jgi:hypothetical protein